MIHGLNDRLRYKMKLRTVIIFVLFACIPGGLIFADEPASSATDTADNGTISTAPAEQPVSQSPGDTGNNLAGPSEVEMPLGDSYSFIRSIMALSFVLGLIFLAAYFFKKITGLKSYGGFNSRKNRVVIQQVGTRPLGDKKFLSVIEIQGKHYFIGITQTSINMLSEIQLEPEFHREADEGVDEGGSFASVLHKAKELLNKGKK
jgi:flagellar biosynthetic protein FliO